MRSFRLAPMCAMFALVLAGWIAACSSNKGTSPTTSDTGPDCGVADNEAGCPGTYDTATLPPTCAPIGLTCAYPGAGDGPPAGSQCAATAMLWCQAGSGDAGPHWIAAQ